MTRYAWSRLSHLQVGRYGEYFVKMECTLHGFDVYSSEVDDRGIDFIIRSSDARYFDIQVKAVRGLSYIFFRKSTFHLRPNLLAAVVLLNDGHPPHLYLIPSLAWKTPDALFVDRDYEGRSSPPEWGLNLARKNLVLLEQFCFDRVITRLL